MNHRAIPEHQRTNAKSMRKSMTEAERKLWNELRAHLLMGLGFRRQLPIGHYIVDFACPEHKLVIEVDGSGHGDNGQISRDETRTRFLEHQGWQVLRLWNDDVLKDIDAACSHILAFLTEKGAAFS